MSEIATATTATGINASKGTAARTRAALFRSTLIVGTGIALAGCINLDMIFGQQEQAAVEMGPKAEFSCYREARYLDLTPAQCERVGGLPVGYDKTAVAETAPAAAPHQPMAIEPLPPIN